MPSFIDLLKALGGLVLGTAGVIALASTMVFTAGVILGKVSLTGCLP